MECDRNLAFIKASIGLRDVMLGCRALDWFLTNKDGVASELAEMVHARAKTQGVELIADGICVIIPPGEIEDLMSDLWYLRRLFRATCHQTKCKQRQRRTRSPLLIGGRADVKTRTSGQLSSESALCQGNLRRRRP